VRLGHFGHDPDRPQPRDPEERRARGDVVFARAELRDTPDTGARVIEAYALPSRSTAATCASVMPASSSRSRAARWSSSTSSRRVLQRGYSVARGSGNSISTSGALRPGQRRADVKLSTKCGASPAPKHHGALVVFVTDRTELRRDDPAAAAVRMPGSATRGLTLTPDSSPPRRCFSTTSCP
jgi:hypothetical protein